MADKKLYSEPSDVESRPDAVDVVGPDHVEVSLTPEAATIIAGRLLDKAAEAVGKGAVNADADRRGLTPPYKD